MYFYDTIFLCKYKNFYKMLAGATEHAWAFCTQLHSLPQQKKILYEILVCEWRWPDFLVLLRIKKHLLWVVLCARVRDFKCLVPMSPYSTLFTLCVLLCTWGHYLLASYPLPACFLGPACGPLMYILSISHSVHIDAAGLQVDLLLSELQTAKRCTTS